MGVSVYPYSQARSKRLAAPPHFRTRPGGIKSPKSTDHENWMLPKQFVCDWVKIEVDMGILFCHELSLFQCFGSSNIW